jgi:hypothetical protein
MNLWVDDIRTPPGDSWMWAKTSAEALVCLQHYGPFDEMSLDHDLGGDDTTRPVVLWLCEHGGWPKVVRCHSSNPPGREWVEGMISRYQVLEKS